MFNPQTINSEFKALIYLTECQLATVSALAIKKTRGKNEFMRQVGIAQNGIDFVLKFTTNWDNIPNGYRVKDILLSPTRKVIDWVQPYLS